MNELVLAAVAAAPTPSAATPVECVEGCGGDAGTLLLAAVGVAISFVALIIAGVGARYARQQRDVAKTEHDLLLDQVGARADLRIELLPTLGGEPIDETTVAEFRSMNLPLHVIRITNVGRREARGARRSC